MYLLSEGQKQKKYLFSHNRNPITGNRQFREALGASAHHLELFFCEKFAHVNIFLANLINQM